MRSLIICLLGFVLLCGCRDEQAPGIENSGLHVIGNKKKLDLVSLTAYPDGGFLLGGNSRLLGNQRLIVSKYDANLNLEWERVIGGSLDNKFFKLTVDKQGNIVVAGFSYGFGHDTVPLNEHKWWNPYVHLLTSDGQTIWEISPPVSGGAGQGSGIEERITDILQDQAGNYLFSGEVFGSVSSSIHPVIFKVFKGGDSLATYDYGKKNPRGKMEAIFEYDQRYYVFNYWRDANTDDPQARVFQIPNWLGNSDLTLNPVWTNWVWPDFKNNRIGGHKQIRNGNEFIYNYFFSNQVYRYTYKQVDNSIRGDWLPLGIDHVVLTHKTLDDHFLLFSTDGEIYELDEELGFLNSFKTNWNVGQMCKLSNGEYVIGLERNDNLYLVHYDQNGKIRSHE